MQIRQTSNRSLLLSMLIIASMITLTLMHNNISDELYQNEQHRSVSYRLADQLRSNSNNRTEVIRRYVDTSKRELFESYINIRATQLNFLPQPLNENTIAGTQLAFIVKAEPFIETSAGEVSTPTELILLQEFMESSKALIVLEKEAIAILDNGKSSEAVKVLHDEAYLLAKTQAFNSIDAFITNIEQRTRDKADGLTTKKEQLFKNYGFLLFIIVAATVFEYLWGTKKIIAPVEELTRVASNMIKGDYEQRANISSDNEIGLLASTFNEMAESIGHDIERRVDTEEKLHILNLAAENANLAKSDFLAKMSHEIRTPMNGVIGMVDLLSETKLKDDQQQMLSTIRDSAYSLLTIINDILDFSKIEAGKLELENIPLSIRDGVESVSETLAANARNKNIRLNIHVDPNIPDAVIGDPVRIRQILFNIGGNAIKFSEKGRVLIRAYLMPTSTDKIASIRFEVTDTGLGIAKEALEDLFTEFSQAESNTTRRFGGTGLGLSICKRLVELMSGTIEVESELGKGSTFSVALNFPVAANDHSIKSDGYDLSGLNILIVADDDIERELDAKYLRHWKSKVTTTGDFKNVKKLALEENEHNTPYDIIIFGSSWSLKDRVAQIMEIQKTDAFDRLSFIMMTQTRSNSERIDIENVVYVESDPIKRANFIRGAAVAAGRARPEISYDKESALTKNLEILSVDEAEANGTLILVAEDNPTNRDVIGRQLNLFGYTAEFFEDGKQALKAWRSKSYAILLTDCHMPEMDGFELTETIRKENKGNNKHFPIIAITASVLKAEVDRCFEAGMDDFLAKPVEMQRLKIALDKWMPAVKQDIESPVYETTSNVNSGVINERALKDIFGDDDVVFKEILNDFIGPSTDIIEEIKNAYNTQDAKSIGAASHKLKSSARSVGANSLADLCAELEQSGKNEEWSKIEILYPDLPTIFSDVVSYIENL